MPIGMGRCWAIICVLTLAVTMTAPVPAQERAASSAEGGLAQVAREPGAPPTPIVAETLAGEEASLSGFVDARLHAWTDHVQGLVTALPGLPAEFAVAAARFEDGLSGRGLAEVGLLLLAFVGVGVAAELLFAWATRRATTRIETTPPATANDRIRAVLTRLMLGLARVLCFAVGSIGGFLAFSWPPQLRRVVLGYLMAVLALRVMLAVGRCLFAPDREQLRVVPMSDSAAAFWQRWSAAFVGWYAFGYVTIELLRQLGMSVPATQILAYLLGLGLLLIVLRMLWRSAAPARRVGRIVATALVVAIWVAWVVGAKIAMWVLIVGATLRAAIPVTHRAVQHLFRPAEGESATPVSIWAVVVDRGVRLLLIVAGIWVLAWALGLDLVEIAGRDTPVTRLLNGAAHAVVILLVADLLWQLVRTVIDRQLEESAPAAGGHGDDHGPQLSPDEARRRGRIRTLLPILRIVLLVVLAVMAILMALSDLGVQIAPLIAGAGVVGVAIGFGSQTLVKDIISGMFYLLDDAFRVGEYIVSGNYRGTVEGFSLRSIRLRHHRGPIFTVPFGMLGAVQNLSRDWVIDKITVGVTYDTDLDLVKKVVKQVSKEIMADPILAKGIIEPLKSQGVAAMGDFAIQVTDEVHGQARRAVRRPPRDLRQDQEGVRRQRHQVRLPDRHRGRWGRPDQPRHCAAGDRVDAEARRRIDGSGQLPRCTIPAGSRKNH